MKRVKSILKWLLDAVIRRCPDTKSFCKVYGHKFNYFVSGVNANQQIRVCRICGQLEEHRLMPVYGWGWYAWVRRTNKGAKELLKNLRDNGLGYKIARPENKYER